MIKIQQPIDTGNIGHTRHIMKTDKTRIDNPENTKHRTQKRWVTWPNQRLNDVEKSCRNLYSLQSHDFFICYVVFFCIENEVKVFNAPFNNISVTSISWLSVLLMEETEVNHRPFANHWQTLSYNVVSSTPRPSGIRTHNISGDRYWMPM